MFLFLLVIVGVSGFKANDACPHPTNEPYGTSCFCKQGTSTFLCGKYPELPIQKGQALVVTSQEGVAYMEPQMAKTVKQSQHGTAEGDVQMGITLDVAKTGQRILGFGGAFTDSTAYHYSRFSPATKEGFVKQYWGGDGIGYSVGRVPMNGVDFSRMNYALHNVTGDTELKEFCLRDDTAKEVPCGTDYKAP